MFKNFDFLLLDDNDFKEDSVREEIVLPIIKNLEYSASSKNKIIRSKNLLHPFVAIGSKRQKIHIIPDYLLCVDNNPYWVLDAKSPKEEILKSKHVEQAYSYSIHPEVRVNWYALCNGRHFSLYHINKFDPVMYFEIRKINENWDTLKRILHPEILADPEIVNFEPDYGLHFVKLGRKAGFQYLATSVHSNYIMRVSDNLYTTGTLVVWGEKSFFMSLDFDEKRLNELYNILPEEKVYTIKSSLSMQPYTYESRTEDLLFGVCAELGENVYNNSNEAYCPFIVTKFFLISHENQPH